MAPSGAGLLLGCLFVLLLAARWARAEANVTATADSQCKSLSDAFSAALDSGMTQPKVALGPGCNILTRNFACTPISRPLIILGAETGDSTWDINFSLYQFSVEPGIVVTIQNMVLARALVFTSVNEDLQPSLVDTRPSLQLSIFHMRPGSRLVLQNVTIQRRCATPMLDVISNFPGAQQQQQPSGSSSDSQLPAPVWFQNTTLGAVTLLGVTVSCGSGPGLSGPVDLNVHNATMLSAFLAAASALPIPSTLYLMENITLPSLASATNSDSAVMREGLVKADTVITGASNGSVLTYVDANYTSAWLTVQWPAQLTLRHLVLTRLRPTIVVPGGSNGLLAGGLPLVMLGVSGSPTRPVRFLEDVTVLAPQYEVTELSYWCFMFSVGTPELKSVGDFLRPYVWPIEFEVLDPNRLLLRRVYTATSNFSLVLITSVPPPGVPFDPNIGPPNGAATYQHVMPPLFFISTGAEWADAAAPVLPRDTWSSPPPQAAAGAAASAAAASGSTADLPALLLINGTVTLHPSDVRVPGGGTRAVRRSVVVTSMRYGCGVTGAASSTAASRCAPAVLDMGSLMNAMRVEGTNTTVVFTGVTLRNTSLTLGPGSAAAAAATTEDTITNGFFTFDRSSVRVSLETVTMELQADVFAALHRHINSRPRGVSAGDVAFMNESHIQMVSFEFGGLRGSYVNFTLMPGGTTSGLGQAAYAGSGGGVAIVPIVVGTVVGSVGLLLLVVAGFMIASRMRRRRRRRQQQMGSGEPGKGATGASGGGGGDGGASDAKRRVPRSTSRSAAGTDLSVERSGGSGGDAAAATAAASTELPRSCEPHEKVTTGGEDSPQCTTLTISDVNSSGETATPLKAVMAATQQQLAAAGPPPPAALQLAAASASEPMPRRASFVARSVPEGDELGGADASIDSSGRADVTSCSSSAGGVGRRLLMEATAGGETAAAVAAAAISSGMRQNLKAALMPSLLDSQADASVHGSTGGGGGSGGGAAALMLAPSSAGSARRMTRTPSGGRAHLYGVGEGGRHAGLRVRAALGRSPSRPNRSSGTSGSNGPSTVLPSPQPALLSPSPQGTATASPAAAAAGASGSGARPRADRALQSYHCQQLHLRHGGGSVGGSGRRREPSNPALVAAAAAAAAAGGSCPGVEATAARSAQLMGTGGALEPLEGGASGFDGEAECGCSPDVSNSLNVSLTKVPEPASEVQRLIQELSSHGTDQLVILEPIGQGGYGTVYRGVWRNLDVAVKTVLFQDRATNLTSPQQCGPAPAPASVSASASAVPCTHNTALMQTVAIEEDGKDGSRTGRGSRPGSCVIPSHVSPHIWGGGAATGSVSGRDAHASGGGAGAGGGGGGGTHNWAFASQQAANSGSLPSVNLGPGAAVAAVPGGPLGPGLVVASQQRAVLEAAVSCSVAHPNVVATYHYDITPIPRLPCGVMCSGGMLVSDGYVRAGGGTGGTGGPGGPNAAAGVVSDWKLYLVQEFCDGGSLANALDARAFHDAAGMPNLALTLCALADIARGMAHIHSRSIVHGDLNPANILLRSVSGSNGGIMPMWNRVALVAGAGGAGAGSGSTTPAGGGGGAAAAGGGGGGGSGSVSAAANLRHELGVTMVAKVADFGLCGMLAPGKRHISNAVRGTPFYTAPETVATGTLTKASDVYSFGVIAWEVYTGRPPFQHVPDRGFVRDESFPRLPLHVPATFGNMALACVNADPEARPTFDQILERLISLQSKLAVSLQQRLSRLMASSGAFLGAASPLGAATAVSTPPHGATTPTAGCYGSGAAGGAPLYGLGGGGGHAAMMPPQSVCCAGVARGMAAANALAAAGGGSPGLLAGGGAVGSVPNFPLSTPCVLPLAGTTAAAGAGAGGGGCTASQPAMAGQAAGR